jgi:hypothetical protein
MIKVLFVFLTNGHSQHKPFATFQTRLIYFKKPFERTKKIQVEKSVLFPLSDWLAFKTIRKK